MIYPDSYVSLPEGKPSGNLLLSDHLRLDGHSLHGALLPGELLRHHADLSEAALPELLVVHDVVLPRAQGWVPSGELT